ncbi:cytochrome c oxidase subunit II [Acidovorax sp. Root219]|uniref:cytochrome c oxidase subunit II n=1 Tax=Acidovorax sp. Root219 TaxID=1736493 RepID=UPI00070AAD75|nr:cytochrome c oxidase subunit II [Acidovorax sp. Root219]KRC17032.1 cytochrome C oxidase subunit II [Acidovorax sp. Root219]
MTVASTLVPVLSPAGPAAQAIAEVSWVLITGATLLFVGTMALLAWALFRKKQVGGELRTGWWLAGGGLVLPLVVLTALFFYSLHRAPPWKAVPPADALVISVTGRTWWWEIRYRDPVSGATITTANELRMPVGRPVYLGLSSAEVIHSLWIPELGGKMDMVPGRVNHLLLQASRAGVYRGQCAEFCGEAHARMALHAVAMEAGEFDAWLAGQARPAVVSSSSAVSLQAGRAVFEGQKCAVCHTVRGVAEGSKLGPDLTHVGSRLFIASGTLKNGPLEMKQWLAQVHEVKPGARMPSYARLSQGEMDALAQWLGALK